MTYAELMRGDFPLMLKIIFVVVMIIIFAGVYVTYRQLQNDNARIVARKHDRSQ